MKLNITKRNSDKKSEAKQLRREGKIPVAVYARGKSSETMTVDRAEVEAILRSLEAGMLSTTKLILVDESKNERTVIVKDIQYHPISYNIIHMDFEELVDDVPVNVNVPIVCTGIMDCAGIKLGGVLRQVIRKLKVRCLPKDIPDSFKMDVSALEQKQSRRLVDLEIPSTVRPLANMNEVAVAIVKR